MRLHPHHDRQTSALVMSAGPARLGYPVMVQGRFSLLPGGAYLVVCTVAVTAVSAFITLLGAAEQST